jgi:hypothetical protein
MNRFIYVGLLKILTIVLLFILWFIIKNILFNLLVNLQRWLTYLGLLFTQISMHYNHIRHYLFIYIFKSIYNLNIL